MIRIHLHIILLFACISIFCSCSEDYDPEGPLQPTLSATYTKPSETEFDTDLDSYSSDEDWNNSEEDKDINGDFDKDEYKNDNDWDKNSNSGSEINIDNYPNDTDWNNSNG